RQAPAASTPTVAGQDAVPVSGTVTGSRGAEVGSASGSWGAGVGTRLAGAAGGGAARADWAGPVSGVAVGAGTATAATRVGPVPAAPATRRLARELGVDLAGGGGAGAGGGGTGGGGGD